MCKNGFGTAIENMTLHDMSFYYVECINQEALTSYVNSGIDKEESNKNPFYYPYQLKN